jgi:CII-binding regulator of phage lambda lysogenization HflD
MKMNIVRIAIACFVVLVQLSGKTEGQTQIGVKVTQNELDAYKENYHDTDLLKKKGEIYYQNILSPDFDKRNHALYFFDHFKKEEINEKTMNAFIDLFKSEVKRSKKFADFVGKGGTVDKLPNDIAYLNNEDYGLYHDYLCRIVGKSGDRTMLQALVERCPMPEVLVNFGDDAVEPVITALKSTENPSGKMNALFVLDEMLKPKKDGYVASGEMRNKIKKALTHANLDKDRLLKSVSVKALGNSVVDDVIPILEGITKNDPDHFFDKDISTGRKITRYPVREEAEKALKKLKEKKLRK